MPGKVCSSSKTHKGNPEAITLSCTLAKTRLGCNGFLLPSCSKVWNSSCATWHTSTKPTEKAIGYPARCPTSPVHWWDIRVSQQVVASVFPISLQLCLGEGGNYYKSTNAYWTIRARKTTHVCSEQADNTGGQARCPVTAPRHRIVPQGPNAAGSHSSVQPARAPERRCP